MRVLEGVSVHFSKKLFVISMLLVVCLHGTLTMGAQTATKQLLVNYVETVEGGEQLGLDIYFTVTDERGRVIVTPEIDSAEIVLNDFTATAIITEPDTSSPLFVLLALDVSGSMEAAATDMIDGAIAAVENAPPETQFGVLTFSESLPLIQPFTSDYNQVIRQLSGIQISNEGTKLYDAIVKASDEAYQKAASVPRARGAVIIFTDGRDECIVGQGDKCSQFASLEDALNVATPIYTIGLVGEQGANADELARIAAQSGGLAVVGEQEQLDRLFQEIMTALGSQLVAQAGLFTAEGSHEAALHVTFRDGSDLSAPVQFAVQRNYTPPAEPLPLNILELDIVAAPAQNRYVLELDAENAGAVFAWKLRVINAQTGNTIDEYRVPATNTILQFPADKLEPAQKYMLEISALDVGGNLLKSANGNTVLLERRFEHWATPSIQVGVIVGPIEVDRNNELLRVPVQFVNPEVAARFSAELIDQQSNELLQTFEPVVENDGKVTIDISQWGARKYLVRVQALDKNGIPLAISENAITLQENSPSIVTRLFTGLRQNLYILPLVLLIIGGVVLYFWLRKRRRRNALGMPWFQSKLKKGKHQPPYDPLSHTVNLEEYSSGKNPEDNWQPSAPTPSSPKMRLYVEKSPGSTPYSRVVTTLPFTLGREGCDLNFRNDQRVSRRHAKITQVADRYYVTDTGASNKTFVDNKPLAKNAQALLKNGTRIGLGQRTMLVVEII